MQLTVNGPIQIDIVPIPGSTLVVEFIVKGSENIVTINIYVTVYYKNVTYINMTDVVTSKMMNVYTSDKDKGYRALIKIPRFKDHTKSFITFSVNPINGPYSKAFIENINILGYSFDYIDESMIEDSTSPARPIEDYHTKVRMKMNDSKYFNIGSLGQYQVYRVSQVPSQPIGTYADIHTAMVIPITKPKIGIQKQNDKICIVSKIIGKGKIIEGPKIVIASIVRNEEITGSLRIFLDCCQELEKHHNNIVYTFIEGDSSDKTYDILKSWVETRDGSILEKIYTTRLPSLEKKRDRAIYLAELRNALIKLVITIPDVSDILMIDANYEWKCDLVGQLRETNSDIAAPLTVSHKDSKGKYVFYDIWSFRKNGVEFWPFHPYTGNMEFDKPVDVDSVGSCYLIKRKVLDTDITYNGDNGNEQVGFCNNARELGFSVKINPKVCIRKIIKNTLKNNSYVKDDVK